MNKEDLKELWDIVFEMDSELLDLSCSSNKAHTMTRDVNSLYFGNATLLPEKEGIFISQYEEMQTKTAIVIDYTYEIKQSISKLYELHDKLTEWYNNHKEE